MDPNATLEEMRALAAQSEDGLGRSDAARLGELVTALDEWLGKGGFLPREWDRQTRTWTLEGDGNVLRDLIESATGARTLRVSVDWGLLKWKRNEDMWTAGLEADR